jgi:hypothetical protein
MRRHYPAIMPMCVVGGLERGGSVCRRLISPRGPAQEPGAVGLPDGPQAALRLEPLSVGLAPSPIWCNVVKTKKAHHLKRRSEGNKMKSHGAAAVRASISFPAEIYDTLEGIAKEKKVSLAWVVREAAEKYIADKWPLLKGQG